jgi:hypothetical protein
VLRWEILEIIEQDSQLIDAILYRPLGHLETYPDAYQLPFVPKGDVAQLISAVLFDGFEPMSQVVVVLPDGTIQKHWTFRLQIIS